MKLFTVGLPAPLDQQVQYDPLKSREDLGNYLNQRDSNSLSFNYRGIRIHFYFIAHLSGESCAISLNVQGAAKIFSQSTCIQLSRTL